MPRRRGAGAGGRGPGQRCGGDAPLVAMAGTQDSAPSWGSLARPGRPRSTRPRGARRLRQQRPRRTLTRPRGSWDSRARAQGLGGPAPDPELPRQPRCRLAAAWGRPSPRNGAGGRQVEPGTCFAWALSCLGGAIREGACSPEGRFGGPLGQRAARGARHPSCFLLVQLPSEQQRRAEVMVRGWQMASTLRLLVASFKIFHSITWPQSVFLNDYFCVLALNPVHLFPPSTKGKLTKLTWDVSVHLQVCTLVSGCAPTLQAAFWRHWVPGLERACVHGFPGQRCARDALFDVRRPVWTQLCLSSLSVVSWGPESYG